MLTSQPLLLAEIEEEPIPIELFEFLGEWQLETGEWIDPNQFENEEDFINEKTSQEKEVNYD